MANKHKSKHKERPLWSPYYERIVKDKTKYTRKNKHKGKEIENEKI